jgi:uncharacterized membrane protein YgdD (TMEM256/DUF423 family)
MTLWVAEFASLANAQNGLQAPTMQGPALATQVLTPTGSNQAAPALQTGTRYLRLHTDAAVLVAVGPSADTATASWRMAANQTEYIGCASNHVLAYRTP